MTSEGLVTGMVGLLLSSGNSLACDTAAAGCEHSTSTSKASCGRCLLLVIVTQGH